MRNFSPIPDTLAAAFRKTAPMHNMAAGFHRPAQARNAIAVLKRQRGTTLLSGFHHDTLPSAARLAFRRPWLAPWLIVPAPHHINSPTLFAAYRKRAAAHGLIAGFRHLADPASHQTALRRARPAPGAEDIVRKVTANPYLYDYR